uniref:Uncharacterized protein n=1 Tax=Branchiostoma floridae TaxID=7739 RepID=C3ZI29_BRAFL|eukprot:XP_002591760.1 hypothetical protein BRAFLDRAFT_83533 [Branchiostoma floridae]
MPPGKTSLLMLISHPSAHHRYLADVFGKILAQFGFGTKPPSPSTPLIVLTTTVSTPKLPTTSADQLTTTQEEETTLPGLTTEIGTPEAETATFTALPGTESTPDYSSPSVQGLQTWEIALIAAGASLGGILVIAAVGYGIYKACRKRPESVPSMRWSHMENDSRVAPDSSCPRQLQVNELYRHH